MEVGEGEGSERVHNTIRETTNDHRDEKGDAVYNILANIFFRINNTYLMLNTSCTVNKGR